MESILKIENLTKIFKKKGQEDFTAVDNISFEKRRDIRNCRRVRLR